MRVCGVVAEYNPFHNGHKYHIDKIREKGFDGIVAVMSGNVVQRGDFAFLEKHIRAKQALNNGVDLVLELPAPFVLSSAQKFAFGSVSILHSLGVVDSLCFGSECGEIEKLREIASFDGENDISSFLSSGVSYAKGFSELVESELGKEYADILSSPNNVLGVEYIRALNKLNSDIVPFTVKRQGAEHTDKFSKDGFCSAGYIRESFGKTDISECMPASSYRLLKEANEKGVSPVSLYNDEKTILSMLRILNRNSFSSVQDLSEGIENRLFSAVSSACSLDELYSLIKTKRYTMSRVKRLVMNALFNIGDEYTASVPPYIRVLGFNEKGREILKNVKKNSSKPIYTLHSDFNNADEDAKKLYSLECKITDLFYCFTPKTFPCGREQTENAVIIK